MNRLSYIVIPTLAFAGCFVSEAKKPQKQNVYSARNVILVLVDDMRYDMLQYAGGLAKTPNLDMLQRESVNFSNACTTNGISSPSRAALFTGRLGHRTGLEDNLHLWHCRNATLPKEYTTLYEWASDKGYNVGYFGKWHVGYITPDVRGVDEYVGSPGEIQIHKPANPNFNHIDKYYDTSVYQDLPDSPSKPDYYGTLKLSYDKSEPKRQVRLGIDFLKRTQEDARPFFLTVSFHSPHPPYRVSEPWDKMYDYRDIQLPNTINEYKEGLEFQHDVLWPWMDLGHMTENDWKKTIAYSMGMVTMLDKAIGELFSAIKALGLWDDSLIVFASDQGSMLAEHGLYDKGPYAYDGLMRIPMLVKAPGVSHHVVKHQVSLIDLNQTMVEYMGLQPSQPNLDSRSLLPLVYQGDSAWDAIPDEAFYTYEFYNGHWFGTRTIRTPEFKYTFNPCGSDELYNLKKDPDEAINLISDHSYKQVLNDLRKRLLLHLEQCADKHSVELLKGYTGIK